MSLRVERVNQNKKTTWNSKTTILESLVPRPGSRRESRVTENEASRQTSQTDRETPSLVTLPNRAKTKTTCVFVRWGVYTVGRLNAPKIWTTLIFNTTPHTNYRDSERLSLVLAQEPGKCLLWALLAFYPPSRFQQTLAFQFTHQTRFVTLPEEDFVVSMRRENQGFYKKLFSPLVCWKYKLKKRFSKPTLTKDVVRHFKQYKLLSDIVSSKISVFKTL